MNFGTNISYNIEHACIIDNKYLLLKGWSYARGSFTKTLISNCGFFLDKVPSMIRRTSLHETNKLIDHPNVGFMYFGKVSHSYDDYLSIELVSNSDVVEVNVKLKHYNSLRAMIEAFPEEDMYWMSDILSSSAV